jgi:serine/threonine protein kinase
MTTLRKGFHLNLQIPNKKSDFATRTKTKTTNRGKKQKINFRNLVLSDQAPNYLNNGFCVGLTGQVYLAKHLEAVYAVKKIDVSSHHKSNMDTAEYVLNIFKAVFNPVPSPVQSHDENNDSTIEKHNGIEGSSSSSNSNNNSNECTSTTENDCCNLVTLHKLFYKHGFVFAVLDLMNAGSLLDIVQFLKRKRFLIPENILSSITFQVLNGLNQLHRKPPKRMNLNSIHSSASSESSPGQFANIYDGILSSENDYLLDEDTINYIRNNAIGHNNLKTSNILLNTDGLVKLQDAGSRFIRSIFNININYTHKMNNDQTYFQNEYGYLAPGSMTDNSVSKSNDIWSLGIILAECCIGEFPIEFSGNSIFSKIINFTSYIRNDGNICLSEIDSRFYSHLVTDFISQCLIKNPEERPSVEILLHHEFITKYNSKLEDSQKAVRDYLKSLLFPPDSMFPLLLSNRKHNYFVDIEIITVVNGWIQ